MLKQYLECGKVTSCHGVQGEVKVQPWCDSPQFFCDLKSLYLDTNGTKAQVTSCRVHKNMVILRLADCTTAEQAVKLRGTIFYMNREESSLAPGEYFVQDLLDMMVYDVDSGRLYGKIVDVRPTGANDVYHIEFANGSIQLIPAIPEVIIEVNPEEGTMKIRPMEGLFDIED